MRQDQRPRPAALAERTNVAERNISTVERPQETADPRTRGQRLAADLQEKAVQGEEAAGDFLPVPTDTDAPEASCLPAPPTSAEEAERSAMELGGMDELGPLLNWVSLDAPRGLLVCKNLDLEVGEFVGTILESRVVRVMKDGDGTVFCASSNRMVADTGRPGRECLSCEDRGEHCFPRWWIAWTEEESGMVFAHTLSQTGTLNFTRYVGKLKREGLLPSQVVTRLFVEEAKRQKTGTSYRRLQFEQSDPFV